MARFSQDGELVGQLSSLLEHPSAAVVDELVRSWSRYAQQPIVAFYLDNP